MKEIWKDIPEFEGYYQVSSLGNIRSTERPGHRGFKRGNVLDFKNKINQFGYYKVNLSKNNKSYTKLVHRLVALAFLPRKSNKLVVNHIDGNKSNNNINNLEWVTHKENLAHAIKLGLNTGIVGENNIKNKLTVEQVLEIRKLTNRGLKLKEIAEDYRVSVCTVSEIKNRKTWKHL